ncbi:hypothetical protein GCM10009798_16910 [Nocardioides panacihumi]|uniref:Uncharacterized protein n=1 Tax=Nocardioides panacihumi TaxID=400774 RepID=A0ABP5CAQ3_9ACTN
MELKSGLNGLTDRGRWSARGASFVAKLKATKMVWFPPDPADTGKAGAAAAKKTTKTAAKKSTGAARKSTSAAKKTGAAKKTAGTAKKTAATTK